MSELPTLSPDDFADVVVQVIKAALEPIKAQVAHLAQAAERLAPLEAKLRELETKASVGVQWAGVYKANTPYDSGQLVTSAGSLWVSTRTTAGRPGGEDSGWTLIVKRGDYGKRPEGAA